MSVFKSNIVRFSILRTYLGHWFTVPIEFDNDLTKYRGDHLMRWMSNMRASVGWLFRWECRTFVRYRDCGVPQFCSHRFLSLTYGTVMISNFPLGKDLWSPAILPTARKFAFMGWGCSVIWDPMSPKHCWNLVRTLCEQLGLSSCVGSRQSFCDGDNWSPPFSVA